MLFRHQPVPRTRALLLPAFLSLAPFAFSQSVHLDTCIPDPALAASIPNLTYDVVSIRPHDPNDGGLSINPAPNGSDLNVTGITLENVIEIAYGVSSFQLTGGASPLLSQRFDLHAKSDDPVRAQFLKLSACQAVVARQRMLEGLFADRFKLTIHRSSKEVSAYNLVVAKSGPKLTPSPALPPEPDPEHPRGARIERRRDNHGVSLIAHDFPTQQLASYLTGTLNLPVADKTHMSGIFDFTLQWSSDDTPREDSYPSLFTAFQEQLGLKLEPTKSPIEIIIIDHIEPPTEN